MKASHSNRPKFQQWLFLIEHDDPTITESFLTHLGSHEKVKYIIFQINVSKTLGYIKTHKRHYISTILKLFKTPASNFQSTDILQAPFPHKTLRTIIRSEHKEIGEDNRYNKFKQRLSKLTDEQLENKYKSLK